MNNLSKNKVKSLWLLDRIYVQLTGFDIIDFFRDSFNDVPLTIQEKRSLFYKTYAESLSVEDWLEMDREDVTDLILPGDTE